MDGQYTKQMTLLSRKRRLSLILAKKTTPGYLELELKAFSCLHPKKLLKPAIDLFVLSSQLISIR